ncbi:MULTISPECIES: MFS transporter [unclassified Mesorhizobium]|uniref:MFS transporter n=1 Tax=unclassified Mesorhizobium TaxID=325217 RepID=UPI000BAFE1F4|nr:MULTISPECIES: MFS transporter [unclassified Mesorhizobium]TGT59368.1 MFS transporter [Mesorhizobium sp. M00.F.Ca.ET.170.01.1.1]AZO12375.1 MFS transporter [Mesorhizobium sp. M3A.F.Ca.ET.080.04.2.1]PBB85875.1 MFS transporter [Mesorhizobium sp. WSM3876]RWB85766.1 MAG: MFS transporter [Mesorhizobium sp.]RWE26368.1 MAG: MFS transporter [Mesorhizobium sp.]
MTAETTATATTRFAPAGEMSILLPATVACSVFMTSLDQNVVVTALPGIGESLDRPASQLGLLITVYVASLIATMPLGGWLADRFGLRNVYCFALLVFAGASALCGVSENIWMLVGSRALQGFGGALMGTLGQVVILSSFPRDRTLKINMYISLAGQSGPLVGPLVGGALTTYVSWRWIFYINIPIALTAALLAASLFPSTTKPARTPFDFPGFLLVGSGMGLLVFGMDSLAAKDVAGSIVGAELGLAIAILTVAAFYCLRARNPLLDLNLLRIRTFRISFLTGGGLDTIGLSSVVFLLPLMFQLGFGMSAVEAGSLTFVAAIGSLLMRFFMPRILNRFGFKRVLVTNTPIVAGLVAGFALMQASLPAWVVLAYIFTFGAFRSVQWASTGNLSYSDIAPEQLARFSALYYILWQLAVALSVGLAAALLSLLAGSGHASVNDFRILFVIEGLITLCALSAYLRLTPQDGAHVSGHAAHINAE